MFQEAESLLCCEAWPAAQQLLQLAQQHMPYICDVKALEDTAYYRLNSSKVNEMYLVPVMEASRLPVSDTGHLPCSCYPCVVASKAHFIHLPTLFIDHFKQAINAKSYRLMV